MSQGGGYSPGEVATIVPTQDFDGFPSQGGYLLSPAKLRSYRGCLLRGNLHVSLPPGMVVNKTCFECPRCLDGTEHFFRDPRCDFVIGV